MLLQLQLLQSAGPSALFGGKFCTGGSALYTLFAHCSNIQGGQPLLEEELELLEELEELDDDELDDEELERIGEPELDELLDEDELLLELEEDELELLEELDELEEELLDGWQVF